jgi:hypothetical protein
MVLSITLLNIQYCCQANKTWANLENTNLDVVLKHLTGNRLDVELFLEHHSLRQLTPVQMFKDDVYVNLLLLIPLCFEHFKSRKYLKIAGVVER